jgi:tRNA(fMet)-specific endonuclease VapC
MTVAELRFGAEKRNSKKLRRLISTFTASIEVLPFDEIAATEYGKVATALAKKGSPIGHFDALIAAHARSRGLTVVTANAKHFTQVANLRVENWF